MWLWAILDSMQAWFATSSNPRVVAVAPYAPALIVGGIIMWVANDIIFEQMICPFIFRFEKRHSLGQVSWWRRSFEILATVAQFGPILVFFIAWNIHYRHADILSASLTVIKWAAALTLIFVVFLVILFSDLFVPDFLAFVRSHLHWWRRGKYAGPAVVVLALAAYLTGVFDSFPSMLVQIGVSIWMAWLIIATILFLSNVSRPQRPRPQEGPRETHPATTETAAEPAQISSRPQRRDAKEEIAEHLRKHGR